MVPTLFPSVFVDRVPPATEFLCIATLPPGGANPDVTLPEGRKTPFAWVNFVHKPLRFKPFMT
jgi:hypothetical protein